MGLNVDILVSILYACGSIVMLMVILLRRKRYEITLYQAVLITFLLVVGGIGGAKLMYFIENGYFGGQSYYGAIFLVPILLLFLSSITKIEFQKLTSFAAPTGCLMPAVLRIGCYLSGCCGGNDFFNSISPIPLQLIDAFVSISISVFLILFEKTERNKQCLYGWYMLIYGFIRFILNSFRADLTVFILLPAGHFWSVISFGVGLFYVLNADTVNDFCKNIKPLNIFLKGGTE